MQLFLRLHHILCTSAPACPMTAAVKSRTGSGRFGLYPVGGTYLGAFLDRMVMLERAHGYGKTI